MTASNYDEPIATELVTNTSRCISLHGCTDAQANGRIQLGGLDGNRTTRGGCAQLEMGTTFRRSLSGVNTRPQRKKTTNDTFRRLVTALRTALNRV